MQKQKKKAAAAPTLVVTTRTVHDEKQLTVEDLQLLVDSKAVIDEMGREDLIPEFVHNMGSMFQKFYRQQGEPEDYDWGGLLPDYLVAPSS